uniref:Protein kinase domain-containing protein n=2 Tax=Caenorhabditis japonica TaxID=281687 RepID=A0A8R1DMB3_CAEJA
MNIHLQDMSLFASGAFSNVYRGMARSETSNRQQEIVIKKTWPRHRGAPLEVKILGKLNRLKHKNIVRLLYSYQKEHDGKICLALIFEYVPLNLHQFLKENNRKIDILEVKLITWQLFRGQAHLQRMEICHRDIKPQNLLYNADTGLLKISDFGSSAFQAPKTAHPSYHVTRYYRPPELLLGAKNYGCEIDIWSCGCVFAELLKGGVFLAGRNTNNQLEQIFDLLGKPSPDELHAMHASQTKFIEISMSYEETSRKMADFSYMLNQTPSCLKERRTAVFNTEINQKDMTESVQLLRQILVYNPQKRLSGVDFLVSPYFQQVFAEGAVRANKKKITCVTANDWSAVKNGDTTITMESISTDETAL